MWLVAPQTHAQTYTQNGGKENKTGKTAVFLMVVSLHFSAACLFGFSLLQVWLQRFGVGGRDVRLDSAEDGG